MSSSASAPVSESSAEGRAYLQRRVALFWKVMFFLCLFGVVMGAIGTVAKPGVDFVITIVLAGEAGAASWLCGRGERSARFSRWIEAGALLLNASGSAVLFRYTLAGFAHDHSIATAMGALTTASSTT